MLCPDSFGILKINQINFIGFAYFQAIKNIGFINLFTRSLPIRIALLGPVVTLQWFLYDTIKVLSGL
jgi:hypothetical protein